MKWLAIIFFVNCAYANSGNTNKKPDVVSQVSKEMKGKLEGDTALARMIKCLNFLAENSPDIAGSKRYEYLEKPIALAEYYLLSKPEHDLTHVESIFLFEAIENEQSKIGEARRKFGDKVTNLIETRIKYGTVSIDKLKEDIQRYFKEFSYCGLVQEGNGIPTALITLLKTKAPNGSFPKFEISDSFQVGSFAFGIYKCDAIGSYFTLSFNWTETKRAVAFEMYRVDPDTIKKIIATRVTYDLFLEASKEENIKHTSEEESNIKSLLACLKFVCLRAQGPSNTAAEVGHQSNNVVSVAMRLICEGGLEALDTILASIIFHSINFKDYKPFEQELTEIGKHVPTILPEILQGVDTETRWEHIEQSVTRMKEAVIQPEATVIIMADILYNIVRIANVDTGNDDALIEYDEYVKKLISFYNKKKLNLSFTDRWIGVNSVHRLAFDKLKTAIAGNCSQ